MGDVVQQQEKRHHGRAAANSVHGCIAEPGTQQLNTSAQSLSDVLKHLSESNLPSEQPSASPQRSASAPVQRQRVGSASRRRPQSGTTSGASPLLDTAIPGSDGEK